MTRLSNPFPSAPRLQSQWSDSVALIRRFTHPIALGLCLLSFTPTALQAAPVTRLAQSEASTPVGVPSRPAPPSVQPKPTPSPSVSTPNLTAPLRRTPPRPPSEPAATPHTPLPTPATPAPATPAPTTVTPQSEPIQIVLRLGKRRVYVYQGKTELASYPVAIGRTGWETPKGDFKVLHMLKNPAWQHPWNGQIIPAGPDNPLGDRWVAFWTDGKNYIGFHGTPNEELVGQAVSHGCVRMKNKDIRALFNQVAVGTPVKVE